MIIKTPALYANLINRVNIFQFVGDARQADKTLCANLERIVTFYRHVVPSLTSRDIAILYDLLLKMYLDNNCYQRSHGQGRFIVDDFSEIYNQEWPMINVFIILLQYVYRQCAERHDVRHMHILYKLIAASKGIKRHYYSSNIYTVVGYNQLCKIITHDFGKKA